MALGHLGADPTPRGIPFVGVPASAIMLGRRRILAAGFDGYQSKPIDVKGFVQVVAEVLANGPRRPA